MDQQHSVAGIGGFVRIGEREYRLRPLTLGDLAELKAYIVSLRDGPLNSPAAIREMRRMRGVTAAEFEDYLDSFDGVAHVFWLMARDACPVLDSFDAAKQRLGDCDQRRLVELQMCLDRATGFLSDVAPLGNLSGRARATRTTAPDGLTSIAA
jgi:hypothetical protein